MTISRRDFLGGSMAATTAGVILADTQVARAGEKDVPRQEPAGPAWTQAAQEPGVAGTHYQPVIIPNGRVLDYKVVNGVKVFHMIAEPVLHEFAPGIKAQCWGYNGQVHGPVIEIVQGDRVRIYVTNKISEATAVHWHGLKIPCGMDGVAGLSQKAIQPGETYKYEFTVNHAGTYMYHAHHDEMLQMALGMMGMFIVHPRKKPENPPDRDFVILLSEWRVPVGASRPDPNEMTDFNILTMNAKCYPGTAPLVIKEGQRVRIRIGNLSAMDNHPIHIHGHSFKIVATDGGDIPESAQWPETTVLVPTGSTRDIEFIADNPGDWPLHCHMSHHVMNQMGHGLPNMTGVSKKVMDRALKPVLPGYMTMGQDGQGDMGDMGMPVPPNSVPMVGGQGPHDYITMGGMFTIVKIREKITSYEDPGWFERPPETIATNATQDDLKRDGVLQNGN